MKNISSKKGWTTEMTQQHVDPPLIPLIQETHDGKSDKDVVKLKLCRDPTSYTSDLYEFKMSLFDNGEPEDFYCLCVTSIQPSLCQGLCRRARRFNTLVL